MNKYIGTKIIQAEKAMRIAGRVYLLGEPIPKTMEGVEHGYKVVYEDGYTSFSPAGVFEKAYRLITDMTFGLAIEAAKLGHKIARRGWNGKDMFVVYQKAYPQGIPCNEQTAIAWGMAMGDLFRCEPYLQIKMANGSHAMWVPSINDVLAEDWYVVE